MSATTTADRIDELFRQLRTLDVLAETRRETAWWLDQADRVGALLEEVTEP